MNESRLEKFLELKTFRWIDYYIANNIKGTINLDEANNINSINHIEDVESNNNKSNNDDDNGRVCNITTN